MRHDSSLSRTLSNTCFNSKQSVFNAFANDPSSGHPHPKETVHVLLVRKAAENVLMEAVRQGLCRVNAAAILGLKLEVPAVIVCTGVLTLSRSGVSAVVCSASLCFATECVESYPVCRARSFPTRRSLCANSPSPSSDLSPTMALSSHSCPPLSVRRSRALRSRARPRDV